MGNIDNIDRETLKRNRRVAVVVGTALGIALISLVYAFTQTGIAEEDRLVAEHNLRSAQRIIKLMEVKLNRCVEEASRQQQMAAQAAEESRRTQQQCQNALQKALKK